MADAEGNSADATGAGQVFRLSTDMQIGIEGAPPAPATC